MMDWVKQRAFFFFFPHAPEIIYQFQPLLSSVSTTTFIISSAFTKPPVTFSLREGEHSPCLAP